MSALQVKFLEEIKWDKKYKEADTSLWGIPWAWYNKKTTKVSVKGFIDRLNESIMGL